MPELRDSGAYRPGVPRLYRAALPLLRAYDIQRLGLLSRLAPPGSRVLDAGAGQGRFVTPPRRPGYDALGIEPSARGAAPAALGLPVRRTGIEAADDHASSVDVVTLWHVLEHLDDPAGALAEIGALAPALRGPAGRRTEPRRAGRPGPGAIAGTTSISRAIGSTSPRPGSASCCGLRGSRCCPPGTSCSSTTRSGCGSRWSAASPASRPISTTCSSETPRVRSPDLAITLGRHSRWLRSPALAELLAGLAHRGGTIAVLARRADLRLALRAPRAEYH